MLLLHAFKCVQQVAAHVFSPTIALGSAVCCRTAFKVGLWNSNGFAFCGHP